MKKRQLHVMVDKILWEDWDPIGVNEDGGPTDEYSNYVPSIVNLLRDGADISKITKLLHQHANINMGGLSELSDHEPIARKLYALVN